MASGVDFRDFDKKTTAFIKRVEGEEVSKRIRIIVLDLFGRIRKLSPVDTGRYRASWNVGIGKPDLSVAPKGNKGQTISAGGFPRLSVDALKKLPVVWITNNLPYAEPLENGHSGQAPEGVVRTALAQAGYGRNTRTLVIS